MVQSNSCPVRVEAGRRDWPYCMCVRVHVRMREMSVRAAVTPAAADVSAEHQ